eukprot:m.257431 g.257431  ORF g.257431 m.257431 type:complete len:71 (-) comp35298_c0_seq1:136-348(-)
MTIDPVTATILRGTVSSQTQRCPQSVALGWVGKPTVTQADDLQCVLKKSSRSVSTGGGDEQRGFFSGPCT